MNNNENSIALIGYACGIAAGITECSQGPNQLQSSQKLGPSQFHWIDTLTPKENKHKLEALPAISEINKRLAELTFKLTQQKRFFITIGGDHSCAIGTWGGAATAIYPQPLGLIWIDAHLDSNTPQTTLTDNIHGMPLAALLGYGDSSLTTILSPYPKLRGENVCVIGARAVGHEEEKLLEKNKVKIFFMDEVKEKGFKAVLNEAINHVTKNTTYFGVSLDLDAIDPMEAPGVGTPEPQGIELETLYQNFHQITENPMLVAAEIVEFNPTRDIEQQTEDIIINLLNQFYAGYQKRRNL